MVISSVPEILCHGDHYAAYSVKLRPLFASKVDILIVYWANISFAHILSALLNFSKVSPGKVRIHSILKWSSNYLKWFNLKF